MRGEFRELINRPSYISANQRDWDEHLPLLLLAYRSSVHESTKQTPFMMMFGKHVLITVDLACPQSNTEKEVTTKEYVQLLKSRLEKVHNFARSDMAKASDKKKTYDHGVCVVPYSGEDQVWLRNPLKTKGLCPKLQPRWEGPYKIRSQISDFVLEIENFKAQNHIGKLFIRTD